jgi:hypothetical protein
MFQGGIPPWHRTSISEAHPQQLSFAFALAVSVLPIATPATSSFTPVRIIDSGGSRISSIYFALTPDPRFAKQLGLIARRRAVLEEPPPAFRTLGLRQAESSQCKLLTTAFRGARVPRPPTCNGQYMVPQFFDGDEGCGGTIWEEFSSMGTNPCSGYYYDTNIIGDCNGCELAERGCNSCE